MKRGPLGFLGRKNQSLFDTNIKIKDMDNVELVLDSPAILESGTASVRARPTVKHHSSSSLDSFQGHAVPTPKVPVLPPFNGPKVNGLVSADRLSNGSVISVPDLVEGEILVPPPPSTAPPPPPGTIIPPDFMGDLNTLDLSKLQPSLAPSFKEEDFTFLQPPPMAPPKPPSTCSSGSATSIPISSPPVPDHPKYAPPQPPLDKQHKTFKTPPPKPIRLSSMSALDSPPQSPAPPPPVHTPTLSTFNPQSPAKIYNIPKTSVLSEYDDRDTRPKQMLVLEDFGSNQPAPVPIQLDGKAAKMVKPLRPVSKDLNDNFQIQQPSSSPLPEPKKEVKTEMDSAPPQIDKALQNVPQTSPKVPKVTSASDLIKDKPEVSLSHDGRFSPLLDRKLRNLKSNEHHGARDGHAASPLALLMAAKERDKHRSTHTLSRENSDKKNEQPSSSIRQSDSSPNSFIVTPRSLPTSQDVVQESPKPASPVQHTQTVQTPQKPSSPALVRDQKPFTRPALNRMVISPSATNLALQKKNEEPSLSKVQPKDLEDNKEELNIPLLPPPPEFDDLDEVVQPPPFLPPPDPPVKKPPTPSVSPLPPAHIPAPPPKTKPPPPPLPPVAPAPPKLQLDVKPKPPVQMKPKPAPPQLPSPLSPNQATLLSILQKKMLEMDHKMAPVQQPESSSDDWGTPLSDEDNKVPVVPRITPQSKNLPVVNKAATLDMRELEKKVARKYQDSSPVKSPTSNGVPSKHQYGMTFTVRPGTKHPITLFNTEESQ